MLDRRDQVHGPRFELPPPQQRTDAANGLVGPQVVLADVGEDFPQLFERWMLGAQQDLRGLGVAENGAQRLIDFVRHDGRELADGCEARGLRKLPAGFLGALAIGDVIADGLELACLVRRRFDGVTYP